MNEVERILTALTPGSIFNKTGKVWRSAASLVELSGLAIGDLLTVLNTDLVQVVTCKPSGKGRGILVALTENIPAAPEEAPAEEAPVDPAEEVEAPLPAEGPEIVILDAEAAVNVAVDEGGPDLADALQQGLAAAEGPAEEDLPAGAVGAPAGNSHFQYNGDLDLHDPNDPHHV